MDNGEYTLKQRKGPPPEIIIDEEDLYCLPPVIAADRSNWMPPKTQRSSFESATIFQPTPRMKVSPYGKFNKNRVRIGEFFAEKNARKSQEYVISLKDSVDTQKLSIEGQPKKKKKITKSKTADEVAIKKNFKKLVKLSKSPSDEMSEWLNCPLKLEEIQIAQRRIKKLHPLESIPVTQLFKTLSDLKSCISKSKDDKKLKEVVPVKKRVFGEIDNITPAIFEQKKLMKKAMQAKLIQIFTEKQKEMALDLNLELREDDQILSDILAQRDIQYLGTNPVKDALKLNKENQQKQAKVKLQQLDCKRDIFDIYGHGIQSYLKVLKILMTSFLLISLFSIPVMVLYGENYMLGNIGGAKQVCFHQFIQVNKQFQHKCKVGKIQGLSSYGVVKPGEEYDYCGVQDNECILEGISLAFETSCVGKTECDLNLSQYAQNCRDEKNKVYIQYKCDIGDELESRRYVQIYVSFTGAIICFFFVSNIYYLRKSANLNYKLWDINTVTPADWTIQVDIPRMAWIKWQNHVYIKNQLFKLEVDSLDFKNYFQDEIHRQIKQLTPLFTSDCSAENNQMKQATISNITLAYANSKLIKHLVARGKLIQANEQEKVEKKDRVINKLVATKRQQFKRPVKAFVTFTQQETMERCLHYYFAKPQIKKLKDLTKLGTQMRQLRFFNERLDVKPAPEPNDLIWENLEFSKQDQNKTKLRVYGFLAVFMILILSLMTYMEQSVVAQMEIFPEDQVCQTDIFESQEQFFEYAQIDKEPTLRGQGHGVYQCFCMEQDLSIRELRDKSQFCHFYHNKNYSIKVTKNLVSALVTIFNMVIRAAVIRLISNIGFGQESQQNREIMQTIFVAQFINTGIILTLASANFESTFLRFIPIRNTFNDFSEEWYQASGKSLVKTMFYGAFTPFIQFSVAYFSKFVYRVYDQGLSFFTKKVIKTRKQSIQAFIELYAGPNVVIHFRYAALLNQIYVTFTYGLALPMLFPICLLSIINQYIVEKLQFAYFYRQPPLYDNRLNDRALGILMYAPIMMMISGYWQFGNRQIFFNESQQVQKSSDKIMSGHRLFQSFDYSVMFLIMLPIFIFIRNVCSFFAIHLQKLMSNKLPLFVDPEWNITSFNESLGAYWESLQGIYQKRWFTQELYNRNILNKKTIEDFALAQLSMTNRRHKVIDNLYNYDILQNPKYADAMFYTQMEKRNQAFLNSSSDTVAKLIYMGESNFCKPAYDELEYLKIATKKDDVEKCRKSWNHKRSLKDRLQDSLRNGIKDIGEDLDIDIELELD